MTTITDPQICPNFPHGPRDCGGVARQAGSDYTCTFCFEQRRSNTALSRPRQDPTPPAVTLLTALAATADLTPGAYRAIFDRLADGRSLRNIELALRSGVSYAWWGRYANGQIELDRPRTNELRAWAGLPELPLSPGEAVAAQAHPDAVVYQVGAGPASRVVLVGVDVPAVTLHVNGNCTLIEAAPYDADVSPDDIKSLGDVQAVTGPRRPVLRGTIHLDRGTWARLNAARLRAGVGWAEFLAPLEDRTQG